MSISIGDSFLSASLDMDATKKSPGAPPPRSTAKDYLDPSMDFNDSLGDVLSVRDGVAARAAPPPSTSGPGRVSPTQSSYDSSPSLRPRVIATTTKQPGSASASSDGFSDSSDDSPPRKPMGGIPPARTPLSTTPEDSPADPGARPGVKFGLESDFSDHYSDDTSPPKPLTVPRGPPAPGSGPPPPPGAYGLAAEASQTPSSSDQQSGGPPKPPPGGTFNAERAQHVSTRQRSPPMSERGRQASPNMRRPGVPPDSGGYSDDWSEPTQGQAPADRKAAGSGTYDEDWSDDDAWDGDLGMPSGSWDPGQVPPRRRVQLKANTTQGRLEAAVAEALERHVSTWDVLDVCNWIEVIGFRQYRQKFAHNSVDGALLMELTDEQMKQDLRILSLGQRKVLKQHIQELQEIMKEKGTDASTRNKGRQSVAMSRENPRNPASASPNVIPPDSHLGPAQGKMTVAEQRAKLKYELDRTINKSAQAQALLDQMARTKNLTDEEAKRLRGQLHVVEKQHNLAAGRGGAVMDSNATVPWQHNSHRPDTRNSGRIALPGEDPNLELTFKPRITYHPSMKSRMTLMDRLESEAKAREANREKVDDLIKAQAEEQQMEDLGEDAANIKNKRAVKADDRVGYWVPGGAGYNHKKPKAKESSAPDKEAKRVSDDIKLLEKCFFLWNYHERVKDPNQDDPRRPRVPYKQLLQAIDDLIDAILPSEDTMLGAFASAVQSFFKSCGLDLEPMKDRAVQDDPFLRRIARLKGMEVMTELDKAKLRLLPDPPKVADIEKERRTIKVKAAAGLVRMANFVGKTYGRSQVDAGKKDGDAKDEEEEEKKKKAAKAKKLKQSKKAEWTAYGPFVPNGTLERNAYSAKEWDVLSKRMGRHRDKIHVALSTIQSAKADERKKEVALDKDAEQAEQFFQLMGWHHATPPDPPEFEDREIEAINRDIYALNLRGDHLNRLLNRALYVATLRERQVQMVVRDKQAKAEAIRKLTRQLNELNPRDPGYKELQRNIAAVKKTEVDEEPLPEVDWSAAQWREDGLAALQSEELSAQRQNLTQQWERERDERTQRALKRAQRAQNLDDVMDTDWQNAGQPGWDVEDELLTLDALAYSTHLLGRLPSSDLRKLLKLPPSGIKPRGGKEADPAAAAGLGLMRFDDGAQDAPKKGLTADQKREKEREKWRRERAAVAKAVKAKKVAVFRNITAMKFVEDTEAKTKEREKRMQNMLEELNRERGRRQFTITPSQEDSFLQRLVDDIEARRRGMEALTQAAANEQRAAMAPFKATPYTPSQPYSGTTSPGRSRYRSRSQSPGPSGVQSPGGYRSTSPGGGGSGAESAGPPTRPQSSSSAGQRNGGFAYWYMSGAPPAPGLSPREKARQRLQEQQQQQQGTRGVGAGRGQRRPPSPGPGARPQSARAPGSTGASTPRAPSRPQSAGRATTRAGQQGTGGQQSQYGRYRRPLPDMTFTGSVGARSGTFAHEERGLIPGTYGGASRGGAGSGRPGVGGRGPSDGGGGGRGRGRGGHPSVAQELQDQMAQHRAKYLQGRVARPRSGLLGSDSEASRSPPGGGTPQRSASPSPQPALGPGM